MWTTYFLGLRFYQLYLVYARKQTSMQMNIQIINKKPCLLLPLHSWIWEVVSLIELSFGLKKKTMILAMDLKTLVMCVPITIGFYVSFPMMEGDFRRDLSSVCWTSTSMFSNIYYKERLNMCSWQTCNWNGTIIP